MGHEFLSYFFSNYMVFSFWRSQYIETLVRELYDFHLFKLRNETNKVQNTKGEEEVVEPAHESGQIVEWQQVQ